MIQEVRETIDCPKHLGAPKDYSILKMIHHGNEYIARLHYLGDEKNVLISKEIFEDVKRCWEEDTPILLQISGRTFRSDGVLIPQSLKLIGDVQD